MGISSEAAQIRVWRQDPNLFVTQLFDVEPSSQQRELLNEVRDLVWAKLRCHADSSGKVLDAPPSDRDRALNRKFGVSVMAGVGTGKGATAAWLIHWFLTCFTNPKIAVTSPSAKQMGITLWAELAKWHQRCKIRDWFTWQSDKFFLKELDGKNWFAATRTANTKNSAEEQAETLAGLHEDFLMIIGDEASGIPDPVFRPLESTLTGRCNFCLLFFNPTKSKGYAYDTHHRFREDWLPVRWNAEESTNVSRDSIERLERKYGRDSNTFRIRVLGLPPVSGENYVIPWDYIVSATERELEPLEDDELIASLDVGAGGDDSVIIPRRGPLVFPPRVSSFEDSRVLSRWSGDYILQSEPKAFLIDNIGVGWGVVGQIRDLVPRESTKIIEVNVAQTAFNPHRFYRLRDELWWRLRLALEAGQISLPNDALLLGDLNSPRYEEVAGKIKVESKKDMRARGIDSPNRADALMQTMIYEPEIMRKLFATSKHPQRKRSPSGRSWKTL